MKQEVKKKQTRGFIRDIIILGIMATIFITLLSIFPDRIDPVTSASRKFFIEMILILPAVMVLMGLFSVWTSNETVIKYLGKSSGIRGIALAIFFGALPTGPMYVAFPIAAFLLRKGARISNIIIFLSAWACIKIPQEMVELQFLGFKFMMLRLVLTILFVSVMGIFIEFIIEQIDEKRVESAK